MPWSKHQLAELGRRSYVSKAGLAAVLTELKADGLIPEDNPVSTRTLKRARDDFLSDLGSTSGDLIKTIVIKASNTAEPPLTVSYIDPFAMLQVAIDNCEPLREHVLKCLVENPCSLSSPWKLCLYSDEVSPGNQLRHLNRRKVQVIYYSFQELGRHALGSEHMWFTLCAARSVEVNRIGGLSALWRHLFGILFEGTPSLSTGLPLGKVGTVLCCKLSILISDEKAIKETVEMKGATGTLNCGLCRNCVTRDLETHDRAGWLVSYTSTDFSKFVPHTNESVQKILAHLQEQKPLLSKIAYDKLEQSLGYNLIEGGLLLDPVHGSSMIDKIQYDWFHIYVVHGIANIECGLFLKVLHVYGHKLEAINDFCNRFNWPSQIRGSAPKDVFTKRDSDSPLKASGSETLNVLVVLRVFILMYVVEEANLELRNACESFFCLCRVLDLCTQISRGRPVPFSDLGGAIRKHLEAFQKMYGIYHWTPKFHMSLHLENMFRRHGTLLSCATHERKHKVLKNFANHHLNAGATWETSLLKDVVYHELSGLRQHSSVPRATVGLLDGKKPTKRMMENFRQVAGEASDVLTSNSVVGAEGFVISRKDCCVLLVEGRLVVGEAWNFFQVEDRCISVVSLWEHVHGFMYKVAENPVVVEVQCLRESVPYSRVESDAIVLVPERALRV